MRVVRAFVHPRRDLVDCLRRRAHPRPRVCAYFWPWPPGTLPPIEQLALATLAAASLAATALAATSTTSFAAALTPTLAAALTPTLAASTLAASTIATA